MLLKWIKSNRGFIVLLLCFGIFRTAVADWNPIPSGSMRPTLLEGDVVFVNRLAYDLKLPLTDVVLARLGEPERGDVVTFSSPRDGTRLIKRIAALPGDTVEMRDEVLYLNGEAARYDAPEAVTETLLEWGAQVPATRWTEHLQGHERRVQWLQGVTAHRSFGPVTVPEGEYLVLGDNRDNSADSRYIGFVPRHLLIGQARRVLVSADILANWAPRLGRFGHAL
ncbi:MAG: signal peptidase I [Pseudomonadota bacterium]